MRAPGSPELYRASSVVSHTEAGHNPYAGRAGTPASVYAQGRVIPAPTPWGTSPQASHAEGQVMTPHSYLEIFAVYIGLGNG
jgi:hypothetical protein